MYALSEKERVTLYYRIIALTAPKKKSEGADGDEAFIES